LGSTADSAYVGNPPEKIILARRKAAKNKKGFFGLAALRDDLIFLPD